MKRFLLILLVSVLSVATYSQHTTVQTVQSSELDKLTNTADITELIINGDVKEALHLNAQNFPNLKRLTYNGDVDYVSGHSFIGCPRLETVEFLGLVGHSDGYCFYDCPELRSITFAGPVLSTGGALYLTNCPKAEHVFMKGLVVATGFGDNEQCPRFKGYKVSGAVLSCSEAMQKTTDQELLKRKDEFLPQTKRLSEFVKHCLESKKNEWLFKIAKLRCETLKRLLTLYDADELCADWSISGIYSDPDRSLPKLNLLKKSNPYTPGKGPKIDFTYASPSDSLLTATRMRFNLDSIAGNGDELSRIKNLLHFVHESVRHDGSSKNPNVPRNFGALYDVCRTENRGVNCRMMAIMLTEVLLAEGIPARYLSCIPKYHDTDPDSHVITIAWSKDLNKWVWVDPTFDAWVTDENGVMLNPAEVRSRLIAGQPLLLNEGANWNHQQAQTVEDYLKTYMAKNLYIIGCNTVNRAEPEGKTSTPSTSGKQGNHIFLVPEGISYSNHMTTDPEAFWAPPTMKEE